MFRNINMTKVSSAKESTQATLKQRERVIKAQLSEIESLRAAVDDANSTADALKKSNLRLTEKIGLWLYYISIFLKHS